jgi:hypothetical protein
MFVALLCALVLVFGATTVFVAHPRILPRQLDLGNGLVFWGSLTGQYPRAGLYRDGELVYAVDTTPNYWLQSMIYFSDDAMTFFLVEFGGGKSSTVSFYDRGVSVRQYMAVDLLQGRYDAFRRSSNQIGHSWLHWIRSRQVGNWDRGSQIEHNREDNLLRITTVERNVVSFDLSTGLILSIDSLAPRAVYAVAYGTVIFVVYAAAVVFKRSLIFGIMKIKGKIGGEW